MCGEKIMCIWVADIIAIPPQPPPRRPLAYAEANESEEEKQFRRVFQQLAGDVSIRQTNIHIYTNTYIKHWLS